MLMSSKYASNCLQDFWRDHGIDSIRYPGTWNKLCPNNSSLSIMGHCFFTAIHNEGDGLTICEQVSWCYELWLVLILILPSNCCCGHFSAISQIWDHDILQQAVAWCSSRKADSQTCLLCFAATEQFRLRIHKMATFVLFVDTFLCQKPVVPQLISIGTWICNGAAFSTHAAWYSTCSLRITLPESSPTIFCFIKLFCTPALYLKGCFSLNSHNQMCIL
jgi:hypothetical protein